MSWCVYNMELTITRNTHSSMRTELPPAPSNIKPKARHLPGKPRPDRLPCVVQVQSINGTCTVRLQGLHYNTGNGWLWSIPTQIDENNHILLHDKSHQAGTHLPFPTARAPATRAGIAGIPRPLSCAGLLRLLGRPKQPVLRGSRSRRLDSLTFSRSFGLVAADAAARLRLARAAAGGGSSAGGGLTSREEVEFRHGSCCDVVVWVEGSKGKRESYASLDDSTLLGSTGLVCRYRSGCICLSRWRKKYMCEIIVVWRMRVLAPARDGSTTYTVQISGAYLVLPLTDSLPQQVATLLPAVHRRQRARRTKHTMEFLLVLEAFLF